MHSQGHGTYAASSVLHTEPATASSKGAFPSYSPPRRYTSRQGADLPSCRRVLRAVLPEPTALGVAKLVKFAWEGTHCPPSCTPTCRRSLYHAVVLSNILLLIPTLCCSLQHALVHCKVLSSHPSMLVLCPTALLVRATGSPRGPCKTAVLCPGLMVYVNQRTWERETLQQGPHGLGLA